MPYLALSGHWQLPDILEKKVTEVIVVVVVFFAIGVFFGIMGNIGVLKFPDVYTRLQASSKCSITCLLSILIGCMLLEGFTPITGRILVIALFFLVTAPVTSHIIGRCAWERGIIPWRRKK
ncbi:monovalent cation/H(+) antiporter subunit G [Candidatus Aerophobetes bacterium]|nr:monovalent cation/H(+) antiporter subunit G [Candidatus Aerophobetes bacterium]